MNNEILAWLRSIPVYCNNVKRDEAIISKRKLLALIYRLIADAEQALQVLDEEREVLPIEGSIYLPVICQNGHKAVAVYRWDARAMEFIFEPPRGQCPCPKSDFGEGYRADGAPYLKGVEP